MVSRGTVASLLPLLIACGTSPKVISITPSQGAAAGGASVQIEGTGFVNGAKVLFGSQPASQVQWTSATELWALTPAGSGVVGVTVRNPDKASGTKSSAYTYVTHPVTRPGCMAFEQRRPPGCAQPATTFQLDITQIGLTSATLVQVAGYFSNWTPMDMQQTGTTTWSTSVVIPPGPREYKFVVDGNWYADPNAPTQPIYGNSVINVVDPCLPGVTINAPAMGANLSPGEVAVSVSLAPGRALDGTPRMLTDANTIMCVDDVQYPVTLAAAGFTTGLSLAPGRHRLSVQTQDSGGFVSPSVWTWFNLGTTTPTPPVADPGPTLIARTGTEVILDGANSWDPDGNPITSFNWSTVDATISFDASQLPNGYLSSPEGYQQTFGTDDPNAMPAQTPARKLYTPSAEGVSTVSLSVADSHGGNTNVNTQMSVIGLPSSGTIPQVVLALSAPVLGPVTIDASGSLASSSATFRWIGDGKNPTALDLQSYLSPNGQTLTLPRQLLTEGVWRFFVWIDDGGASWPAAAQVLVRDGVLRVDNYILGPPWAYQGPIDEIFVRVFYDSDGDGIGDLNGVTEKLDYLQGLGIETLWLMPVFTSNDHQHGYHPDDYYDIEPDYGTRADLLNLIKQVHARGMHIILDMVLNHTSRYHPFFQASLNDFLDPADAGAGDWFNQSYIWFNNQSTSVIDQYGWGRQLGGPRLTEASGWADIPDIDYGDPETRHYFFETAKYWADPNGDGDFSDGVDGYRLDHVTGPDHSMWASFRSELKALNPDLLLLGEVYTGFHNNGYGIVDYYHGEMDTCFTFPEYFDFQDLMSGAQPVTELQGDINELFTTDFPIGALNVGFLENQDVPDPPDFALYGGTELQMALTIEAALPPVPQAIWGQELGLSIWRGWVPWSLEGPDNQLENTFRAVMTARRDQPALRSGGFAWAATNAPGASVGIIRQLAGNPTIVVVANTTANPLDSLTADLSSTSGNTLTLISGTATPSLDAQRQLHVSLPGWTAAMYSLTP